MSEEHSSESGQDQPLPRRSLRAAAREGPRDVAVTPKPPQTVVVSVKPKVTPCAACLRRKEHDRKEQAEREAAVVRRKAKAEKRRERFERRAAERKREGRLPDGARFDVTYSDERVEWSGTLTLADGTVFAGRAPGVMKLLHQLDALYRQSLLPSGSGR